MKYFTVLISNFLLLFVLLPFISSSQEKLDLFVLAGQSNAQGWMGDGAYYPEEEKELDDSILLNWTFVDNESSDGEWVTMQPQKGRFPKGHFGPEVSFGRELKKAGYNPAIFKYTKGATGLARDWKAPGEGGIYDRMTRDLKFAINKLENHGFEVKVHGFIWIQGETDAGNEHAAKDYYHNLKKLINDFRNNVLHKPDLKIILGVDEQHPFVKERPVVVEAQRKLAEEDENIVFSSMMGLPKADATHLTPEGLVKHGKRIFNAYSSKFLDKFLDSENYHSCGSIRELIPDLIETGLDILNPVQFTAAGMDLKGLKQDFGDVLTFWGGGVDTQTTLNNGIPQQVADQVKQIIDILAPGGGFVFAPVHNIQDDVSPENFWAMWDTLQEYGKY